MVFRRMGFVMIYTVASEISLSVLTPSLPFYIIQYGEKMEYLITHLKEMLLVIGAASFTGLFCWALWFSIYGGNDMDNKQL